MKNYKGKVLILLSSLCFSLGGLLVKLIPWQALAISGARSLIAAVMIGGYIVASKKRVVINKTTLFGGLCMMGMTTSFVLANKLTTAANAIALQHSSLVFIILINYFFFRRKPLPVDIAACGLVIAGIVIICGGNMSSGHMPGDAVAIFSGLCYAFVCMLNAFKNGDALSSVFWGQIMSAAIGIGQLVQEPDFSLQPVAFILILGIFQLGLGYILFVLGIRDTEPLMASMIGAIEPVANPVLVAVFYGERMTLRTVVGSAIVLSAVVVYNILKNSASRYHIN